MITLELTEEEASNLRRYLGIHDTESAINTFPVYDKLTDLMDADLSVDDQLVRAVEEFNYSQKYIRPNVVVDSRGLVKVMASA